MAKQQLSAENFSISATFRVRSWTKSLKVLRSAPGLQFVVPSSLKRAGPLWQASISPVMTFYEDLGGVHVAARAKRPISLSLPSLLLDLGLCA